MVARRMVKIVRGIQRTVLVDDEMYSTTLSVPVEGYDTGHKIKLPQNQVFRGSDLTVYLNGTECAPNMDYQYMGTDNKYDGIAFLFDLEAGDVIKFEILDPLV